MELPLIAYNPEEDFAEFWIVMDLKSETLDKVVDVFDVFDFIIIKGIISGDYKENNRTLHVFVESTKSTIGLEELSNNLRRVRGVFEVNYKKGIMKGLAVSQLDIPPKVVDERAIIFRYSVLESWFSRTREVFKEGADVIFYESGIGSGRQGAKFFKENFGLTDIHKLALIALNYGTALGWGTFKLKEYNLEKGRVIIQIEDSFECLPFKNKSKRPMSQYVRGYMVGFAQELFKKNKIKAVETKCIAKGDPYCEIEIKIAKG